MFFWKLSDCQLLEHEKNREAHIPRMHFFFDIGDSNAVEEEYIIDTDLDGVKVQIHMGLTIKSKAKGLGGTTRKID